MKKFCRRVLGLTAALAVCMVMTGVAFAADSLGSSEPEQSKISVEAGSVKAVLMDKVGRANGKKGATTQLAAGATSTFTAEDLNGTAEATQHKTATTKKNYEDFSYNLVMPKAGTLALTYASNKPEKSVYVSLKDQSTCGSESFTKDGLNYRTSYYSLEAGTYTCTFTVYASSSVPNYGIFYVLYAPSATTVIPNNGKVYYHGGPGDSQKQTAFKVKAPSKGFFTLALGDAAYDYKCGTYIKTSGFKDFEYLSETSSSIGNVRWIGASKGTYTFKVKTLSPIYGVKSKFTKVTESKFAKSKKKAAKIKKKKAVKGVIVTNKKQAHWYKFKNPKKQKVKLVFKTKLTGGGNYGGINVTVYYKKAKTSRIFRSGSGTSTMQLYNSGSKLKKGTYYVKVESYHSGTGNYTMTWK